MFLMTVSVYILFSATLDRYYVGCTTDSLYQRIRRHLSEHKGFTARAKDWVLVYQESFENKTDALKREKEIKKWKSAERIKLLIDQINRASR